jgi:ribonuclease HII
LSAFATATEIDTYGITNALNLAITRGLALMTRKVMKGKLQIPSSYSAFRDTLLQLSTTQQIHFHLVIDGNRDFRLKNTFPTLDIMTIIKGDAKIKEIAMASIVAKVSRDNVMSSLPSKYHNYAFAQHKGYGTAFHRAIIAKFGVSDIHRKLFLKQLFPQHCFQKQLPENF